MIPLSQQLFRDPQEIVAWRNQRPLTVADLVALVDRLIPSIQQHATVQNWGITTQDSFHFVAGLLALFSCGKHPVLLSSSKANYLQDIHHYFDAILTDEDLAISSTPVVNIINATELSDNIAPTHQLQPFSHDLTLTLFTSGSTGSPKPISKSLQQFHYESQLLIETWGKTLSDSLMVATVSHQHLYGLTFKIMLSLAVKCPFVCELIQYQEQLSQFSHLNGQPQKLVLTASPATLKTLDGSLSVLPCQHVFSAGGPLTFTEAQLVKRCFSVLPNEIYGSSETGIIATRQQINPEQPWQAFPDVKIIHHDDKTLSVCSPLLPDTQPEKLNDQINLVSDNQFHLLGRTDNIVKIAEQRISLTHVEKQLTDLIEIEQAAPIVLTQNNRTIIAAIVVLSPTGNQQQQLLGETKLGLYFRQQLRDTMPFIALPKRWRFVEAIPTNHQGKRSYLDLKELFA